MDGRTLPPRIGHHGHAGVDQPVQRDETGLEGAAHGAHEDERHLAVGREVGLEVLAQFGGLLLAEGRERRVEHAMVGSWLSGVFISLAGGCVGDAGRLGD